MKLENINPICNIEYEKMLLSQILLDNNIIYWIRELWLTHNDFYGKDTQKIYRNIMSVIKKWLVADMITVEVDDDLVTLALSTTNYEHYAKSIKEYSIKREIIKKSEFIKQITKQQTTDIEEIQKQIDLMLQNSMQNKISKDYKDSLDDYYKELYNDKQERLLTWYRTIDNSLKLTKWQLITIAGRPWMWKSAVMGSLALNMNSCFISVEMSNKELTYRFVSQLSWIDFKIIDNWLNNCNDKIKDKVKKWFWELKQRPIQVFDKKINFLDIKMEMKRQKLINNTDIFFIDYLQIIRPEDTKLVRALQIGMMTRELKAIAKELEVVVVIWSQLNRNVENAKRSPILSDLRESWDIEQDCDIVIFIQRDLEDSPEMLEFIISKYRNWKHCILEMWFDTKTMSLKNQNNIFKNDEDSIF